MGGEGKSGIWERLLYYTTAVNKGRGREYRGEQVSAAKRLESKKSAGFLLRGEGGCSARAPCAWLFPDKGGIGKVVEVKILMDYLTVTISHRGRSTLGP